MDESTIDRLVERIDKLTGFMERREVETLSPYLTTQEAADYLKVSKRTIERMIKSNQIKYYPINQEKNRSKYLLTRAA